jgi:superfamily II DNA or RNA helicase
VFLNREILDDCGWQAFERLIARLLIHKGFRAVRVVGSSGDKGADILGIHPNGKRWLIQAKYWRQPVPEPEMQKTLDAAALYHAEFAVVAALNGVSENARKFQLNALNQGRKLTVWTPLDLINQASKLDVATVARKALGDYQEDAIDLLVQSLKSGAPLRTMLVMATGLGKTFTAAEAVRRTRLKNPLRVLVLAHTNQLLLQLEAAFWPFIGAGEPTMVWNQFEKPSELQLAKTNFIFASRDSVFNYLQAGGEIPHFDLLLVDECHHAHSKSLSYSKILEDLNAGEEQAPMLVGLTATPYLLDAEALLSPHFGDSPLVTIDMVYGLKHGFLSNVNYKMFTDNINWEALSKGWGKNLSPRQVNRRFFIKEWDEAVVSELHKNWDEVTSPKAIVFCGTIEHALSMRDRINARGFCNAQAIHSGEARGKKMTSFERNLMLSDFDAGKVNVVCTVDVFNEGLDVPDVNIIVFNRVTHSRRIFVQQLGRGLRVSPDKDFTLVLDFAQDIRRYAAGINLKNQLAEPSAGSTISIGNRVTFTTSNGEDPEAESFLSAWLQDVEQIELAGDDETGFLHFPPPLNGRIP